ncbi:MAG: TetR/AcrR family transcriptional regulator [Proteobacteria bacterium]|nr:TetR/AcrR family transcriptional regulator [Pseudomonadota bacterium]
MARTGTAREKILAATLKLVREKGFTATTVDDLCTAAGVTKGAFFHHFASKEALGVAAAEHWSATTSAFFAAAPYHRVDDPMERLLAYIQFRRDILRGELAEFTCLVGTMVQEVYAEHPAIGAACNASISGHATTLEPDIAEAMRKRGWTPDGSMTGWSAASLALHTQAVLQGAFILAKCSGGPAIAEESVDHLSRYIRMLFGAPPAEPAA